jgi:hypothetical protein
VSLISVLKRLRTRPPSGDKVELKPMEQVVLALLIRAGSAGPEAVQAEIDGRRPVLAQTAAEMMSALLRQDLAEARIAPDEDSGSTLYVATARGRRLRKVLPPNPSTVTEFWL